MTRAERLQIEAASELLNSLGMPWKVGERTTHLCIVIFDSRGGEHKVSMAGTPRDTDMSIKRFRTAVRSTVTQILKQETARRQRRGI